MEVNTLTKTREQRIADLFTQGKILVFFNNDLRYIIRYVKSLRQKAGQQLLRQAPTNDDLCYIIENVKPLRQEAKSWLYPIIVPQTLEQIMSEIKQLA